MRKVSRLTHRFVDSFPQPMEDGHLYVSIKFKSVGHKCCCGCGMEVVTPLSPAQWRLTFNGSSISIHPSIGNWSFPCKSHYWIQENEVQWSRQFSEEEIEECQQRDRRKLQEHYGEREDKSKQAEQPPKTQKVVQRRPGFFKSIWDRIWR